LIDTAGSRRGDQGHRVDAHESIRPPARERATRTVIGLRGRPSARTRPPPRRGFRRVVHLRALVFLGHTQLGIREPLSQKLLHVRHSRGPCVEPQDATEVGPVQRRHIFPINGDSRDREDRRFEVSPPKLGLDQIYQPPRQISTVETGQNLARSCCPRCGRRFPARSLCCLAICAVRCSTTRREWARVAMEATTPASIAGREWSTLGA